MVPEDGAADRVAETRNGRSLRNSMKIRTVGLTPPSALAPWSSSMQIPSAAVAAEEAEVVEEAEEDAGATGHRPVPV